ncbi:MAG: hypothetical protein P8H98_12975 [Flavobacteriales bacterium]|jgi:hypothetical protein|nr:hypothetical protein [Flavobacteriales bacterium]
MNSLSDAKMHIDSFSRPNGYNQYSWNIAKKMALEVWDHYLNNRPFRKPINYFCNEFYNMIKNPKGEYIVPENSFRKFA